MASSIRLPLVSHTKSKNDNCVPKLTLIMKRESISYLNSTCVECGHSHNQWNEHTPVCNHDTKELRYSFSTSTQSWTLTPTILEIKLSKGQRLNASCNFHFTILGQELTKYDGGKKSHILFKTTSCDNDSCQQPHG